MDWDMQEFTEELAMEWLKKPCWSIAESMLLLGEYQVPVSRRAGYPLPPEFAGNAGNGLDSLIRAIIAQQLKPIANVEGSIRGRFPLYSPADVISVAESIDFGNWKNWKNRLKRLQVTQIQTDTEMVNKIIETERLAEIAKEESYATTPQLWAYDMSIELAERNGGMNYAQRCVVEIQIMRTFEANTDTLPLRQTPTFLLWPKGHPLPPLWRDGLFLRKDELRVWAKEYCPDLLGSSLIAESVATSDAQPEAKEKAQKAGIIQEWQNKVEDMAAELINPCKKPQLICDLDLQCGIPAEEQQRVERRKLGRYTLQEAAALIAQEIGEPAALIEQKLMQGVKDAALIVYAPGSQVRYQSLTVRRFYEEAYWDGLNEWLNKKSRVLYSVSPSLKPSQCLPRRSRNHQSVHAQETQQPASLRPKLFRWKEPGTPSQ